MDASSASSVSSAMAVAKGKGKCPPPPPAPAKGKAAGKGKGTGPPPPPVPSSMKGFGKGRLNAGTTDKIEDESVPMGKQICLIVRKLDGDEYEVEVNSQNHVRTLRVQVADILDIGPNRVRLLWNANLLGDGDTPESCGIEDGDAITIMVLSPIYGNLQSSALEVPDEVMQAKILFHEQLEARGRLIRPPVLY